MSNPIFLNRKGLARESVAIQKLIEHGAIFYPLFPKRNDAPNMRVWIPPGRYVKFNQGTLSGLSVLEKLASQF